MLVTAVKKSDGVIAITINRPVVLNALNSEALEEMLTILEPLDSSTDVGCLLIHDNDKAFAAGADIGELAFCAGIDSRIFEGHKMQRYRATP